MALNHRYSFLCPGLSLRLIYVLIQLVLVVFIIGRPMPWPALCGTLAVRYAHSVGASAIAAICRNVPSRGLVMLTTIFSERRYICSFTHSCANSEFASLAPQLYTTRLFSNRRDLFTPTKLPKYAQLFSTLCCKGTNTAKLGLLSGVLVSEQHYSVSLFMYGRFSGRRAHYSRSRDATMVDAKVASEEFSSFKSDLKHQACKDTGSHTSSSDRHKYRQPNWKDAHNRPRIAAPDSYKALPEPPLDSFYFYHLAARQDILRELSGFLPRLRARLRRALKGSYQKRPWTIDDIFALITWVVMSQAMLLLIGTTTTVSVALWLLNRLQYQDWIARRLSEWVSSTLGISVSFESAIAPAWRHGTIRFNNVKIRCGPEHGATLPNGTQDTNFTMYDLHIDHIDVALSLWRWMDDRGLIRECSMRGVRGTVDRRQVQWYSDVIYNPSDYRLNHRPGYFDLELFEVDDMLLNVHPWQDFRPITISIYSANLPRFRDRWLLYDSLNANSIVGMYDGSLFTIHKAHKHLPAQVYTGRMLETFQSSLLRADARPTSIKAHPNSSGERTAHVQVDNLNIDHINSGVEGPIGWITSGRLNVSALIDFPSQPSGADPAKAIKRLVDDINDSIDVVILPSVPDWSNPESSPNPLVRTMHHLDMIDSPLAQKMHERLWRRAERERQRRLEKQRQRTSSWSQPLAPVSMHHHGRVLQDDAYDSQCPDTFQPAAIYSDPTAVHVDLQVEFNNIRAAVPLTVQRTDYPLLSSVLVRPIIAYMNAHRMSLPMRCQLRLRPDDFDGAWSFWESGADTLMAQGIGAAFVQLAKNERERNRRLKLVGWWSIAAIARQFARVLDYIYGHHSFFYAE